MPPRAPKIPRPPNSFLLYRSDTASRLPPPPPGTAARSRSQAGISQMAAKLWAQETPAVRAEFARRAAERKAEHEARYPGYMYRPRRKVEVETERGKEGKAGRKAQKMQERGGPGRSGTASTEPHIGSAPQTSTSSASLQNTPHSASYHETPKCFDPVTGEVLDLDAYPELSYYAFEQALRDVFGDPDNHIEFYTTTPREASSPSPSPYSSGQQPGGSAIPSWDPEYVPGSRGGVMARHARLNDSYYDPHAVSGGRGVF